LNTVHVWVTIQSLISVQCTSEAQTEKKKTGSVLIHRRTRLNETVSYVSLSLTSDRRGLALKQLHSAVQPTVSTQLATSLV
jgi:hypothetical protein